MGVVLLADEWKSNASKESLIAEIARLETELIEADRNATRLREIHTEAVGNLHSKHDAMVLKYSTEIRKLQKAYERVKRSNKQLRALVGRFRALMMECRLAEQELSMILNIPSNNVPLVNRFRAIIGISRSIPFQKYP